MGASTSNAQLGSIWQSHMECEKVIRSIQLESRQCTTVSILGPPKTFHTLTPMKKLQERGFNIN